MKFQWRLVMEMITFLLQNDSLDVGIFFWGRRYLETNLGKKQTGRDCVGVRFSGSGASRPLNSSLTTKARDSRVNLALQVLALLSGDSWEKVQGGWGDVNYHELSILFSRFMQKKPSLFSMIVERSNFV